MKEKDIREHISAFLRTKLQSLVVPASMGLGMVVGGCSDSPLSANPDGSGDVQPGSGGAGGTLYGIGGSGGAGGSGGIGTLYGTSRGGSGGTFPQGFGGAYAVGGAFTGGAGGSGGSRVVPGGGGVYGIGASWGGGGGGMGGMGGTLYGTGGAKDAAPIDTREIEAGEKRDSLTSEAGAVDAKDALPGGRETL